VAWSYRMNVILDMITGLSEIHNHNEQSSPFLGACIYMYTKLQTH